MGFNQQPWEDHGNITRIIWEDVYTYIHTYICVGYTDIDDNDLVDINSGSCKWLKR
jgi:hypothetical protein